MPAVNPTTGKFGGAKALFLVDGFNLLGAKPQTISHKVTVVTEKSDGLGDEWEEHSPTGKRSAELTQGGAFFNTAAGNGHEALKDTPSDPNGAKRLACVGQAGNVVGQPFTAFEGKVQTEYEVLSQQGQLQRANAAFLISGEAEDGAILHALGAETADANTQATAVDNTRVPQRTIPITSSSVANPSTITTPCPHGLATGDTVVISGHAGSTPSINGEHTVTVTGPTTFTIPVNVTVGGAGGSFIRGKTNAGGAAYLQVTAHQLGTYTGALVTVRHSDDDSVFVDLVAFTSVTASRAAQRVTVAGAVRRYLAVALDRTGAGAGGSITYFCGFCRN